MINFTLSDITFYLQLVSLAPTIGTLAVLWIARRFGYVMGWQGNLALVALVMLVSMIVLAVTSASDMQTYVTLTLLFFALSSPTWLGLTALYSWLMKRGARS